MTSIKPCLWFDGNAEEAVAFYRSIFPETAVLDTMSRPDRTPASPPVALTFRLLDQEFIALNGGPHYSFTPAVSFFVSCDTQAEVDRYWDRLIEGGKAQKCGWLTDRFGLSWQIVPRALGAMLGDADRERAGRAMRAMLGMVKLDIAELERAHRGE